MDIQVTRTGKIFYQIDNAVAALLREAFPGAFQNVVTQPKPEPASATPEWGIGMDRSDNVHIYYRAGATRSMYDGPPDNAVNGFKTRRWSGQKQDYVFEGPVPPPEIIEQYRQAWKPRPFVYQKD